MTAITALISGTLAQVPVSRTTAKGTAMATHPSQTRAYKISKASAGRQVKTIARNAY